MNRPRLKDGKIPEPQSLSAAQHRLQVVERDLARIKDQLDDLGRFQRLNYARWRMSAMKARELFMLEAEQLREWIARQENCLLHEAYDLLKVLRTDLGDDMDPRELATIERLDEYFAIAPEHAKATG